MPKTNAILVTIIWRTAISLALLFAPLAHAASASEDSALSCTPPNADLSDSTPANFTAEQLDVMKTSYDSAEVLGLREAIDSFAAGNADPTTIKNLSAIAKSTLSRRFILLDDESGDFGGFFLIVRFKQQPGSVYRFWVYRLSTGSYEIRAADTAKCSDQQQRWLKTRYPMMDDAAGG